MRDRHESLSESCYSKAQILFKEGDTFQENVDLGFIENMFCGVVMPALSQFDLELIFQGFSWCNTIQIPLFEFVALPVCQLFPFFSFLFLLWMLIEFMITLYRSLSLLLTLFPISLYHSLLLSLFPLSLCL